MREQPEAGGGALVVPKSCCRQVAFHLRGDPIQQIEPLFFLGTGAGGAGLLCKPQFRPQPRYVFMFPGVQDSLGALRRVEWRIAHTLIGLSA